MTTSRSTTAKSRNEAGPAGVKPPSPRKGVFEPFLPTTPGTDIYLSLVHDILGFGGLDPHVRRNVLKHLDETLTCWDMDGLEEEMRYISDLVDALYPERKKRRGAPRESEVTILIRNTLKTMLDLIVPAPSHVRVRKNANDMARLFGLSAPEEKFLTVLHASNRFRVVDSLMDRLVSDKERQAHVLEALLGAPADLAAKIATGCSRVNDNWLVAYDADHSTFTNMHEILDSLMPALDWAPEQGGSMLDSMLTSAGRSSLLRGNYEHMEVHVDRLCRLMASAVRGSARGVNILIHGAPGTGKTELAKLIATEIGSAAYMIGEGSGHEDVDRHERVHDLFMSEALLAVRGDTGQSFLIFDEMEDVTVFKVGEGSKIVMNRFLDGNRVPVVWIANDLGAIPPYLLRRMMMVLEVKAPTPEAQKRMLASIASEYGIHLDDGDLAALQGACDVVPAVAKNAAIAAQLTNGGVVDMRQIYLDVNSAMKGRTITVAKGKQAADYRPELSVTDPDIRTLADRVAGLRRMEVGFVFHGVPGTGKSAAARYIARRIGVKVIEKRGSDIFGMYVGETEKAIRAAFEEARDQGAALIFDEIDSLLSDRSTHQRGFETSQVNEFLKCLEDHEWPVFGCTNLVDNLDPAAMRRFLFKVRFDVLDQKRAAACFRHYLGAEEPGQLSDLVGLVPSDFSVVRKKADILGVVDPAEMVRMLGQEASLRKGVSRPIGFGRH